VELTLQDENGRTLGVTEVTGSQPFFVYLPKYDWLFRAQGDGLTYRRQFGFLVANNFTPSPSPSSQMETREALGGIFIRPVGGGENDWRLVGPNPWRGGTTDQLTPIAPRDERNPDGTMKHPELAPSLPETSGPVVQDGPGPAADNGGKRGFG
jgi:hypothetical protein